MKRAPVPIWLVTGHLGSGKTTLLSRWLREPSLADAVLVINEIGEVGFDDQLLAQAVDSAQLVAGQCVCCTGLPDLQETLAQLWWDRLHRRRPHFACVVIETTGLADPWPLIEALHQHELLRERFVLAGVLTCVSATGGPAVLAAHPEARAQVAAADVLVLTKADRADPAALAATVQALQPRARLQTSAQASLGWAQAWGAGHAAQHGDERLRGAPVHAPHAAHDHHHHHDHDHESVDGHKHAHGVQARFVPMPGEWGDAALAQALEALGPRTHWLRLKGVLQRPGMGWCSLQWAPGDEAPLCQPWQGPCPAPGLTLITREAVRA